jgi:hypothetical protein
MDNSVRHVRSTDTPAVVAHSSAPMTCQINWCSSSSDTVKARCRLRVSLTSGSEVNWRVDDKSCPTKSPVLAASPSFDNLLEVSNMRRKYSRHGKKERNYGAFPTNR